MVVADTLYLLCRMSLQSVQAKTEPLQAGNETSYQTVAGCLPASVIVVVVGMSIKTVGEAIKRVRCQSRVFYPSPYLYNNLALNGSCCTNLIVIARINMFPVICA